MERDFVIIEVKKALHRDFSGTGLAEVRLAPKAVTVILVQAHHKWIGCNTRPELLRIRRVLQCFMILFFF